MSKRNKNGHPARHDRGWPSKIVARATRQDLKPGGATQIYTDNSNGLLVNASNEELPDKLIEDDDDYEQDDDEHHQLISDDERIRSDSVGDEHCLKLNGQNSRLGHLAKSPHEGRARSPLDRLGGLLSSAVTRLSPQASKLHAHNADFVYQPAWSADEGVDSHNIHFAPMHSNAGKLANQEQPAGGGGARPPAGSVPGNRKHKGSHRQSRAANQRRSTLLAVLILVLIGISALMLKLSSLVREERRRVIEMSDKQQDNNQPARTRQDLLSELTKNLDRAHKEELDADERQRWLVSSSKCHIPVIEPWDASITGYIRVKPPMNCSAILADIVARKADSSGTVARRWPSLLPSSLTYVQSNRLFFISEALNMGALSPGQCCFKRISRREASDDELERPELCEPIPRQGFYVNSSVVEISCPAWNYTNVHSLVVHNQEEELALLRVAKERLSEDGDHYSVLMLGVDTISRLNGHRQLSKTLQTLDQLYQSLHFVGYNKLAENTFPNLIPLLTGLKPEQLSEVQCWMSKGYSQESESGDEYLDNCKFLWNFYQQVGYLTYIGEDWPQASTFNYLKPGFKSQPASFYGRPFTLARDSLIYPKFDAPGCASCQLDKPLVEVDLQNLKTFIENNTNSLPYFALHWINCPQHDDLNGASQVDHLIEGFFRELRQRLDSDRTFVIFFSDHGYRWNDFVSTRVGHYETSLPLMTIAPPTAFIKRHPEMYEHMKSHRNALLTPFDLFKTLIHLKDLGLKRPAASGGRDLEAQVIHRHSSENGSPLLSLREQSDDVGTTVNASVSSTGATAAIQQVRPLDGTTYKHKFTSLSLFDAHTEAELDRGCIEAGIPDNYCVCHQFQPISTNRTDTLGAAYYLVYVHLNARLENHLNICHRLNLQDIHHAEIFNLEESTNDRIKAGSRKHRKRSRVINLTSASELNRTSSRPAKHLHGANDEQNKHDYLPNREYSIMFSTKPGGGLFQEVVRFYGSSMADCEREIERTRKVVEDELAKTEDRIESVLTMNDVCDFSVHSESLSRLNLYKDQSRCVKSDIELKKVCYCLGLRI